MTGRVAVRRTGHAASRRSRRLVVSFFATVANYDYGFYFYLYMDGHIESEVKLTGVLSCGACPVGQKYPYGAARPSQRVGPTTPPRGGRTPAEGVNYSIQGPPSAASCSLLCLSPAPHSSLTAHPIRE